MRSLKWSVAISISFLLASIPLATASGGTGIHVRVVTPEGVGVEGARLTLLEPSPDAARIAVATTDEAGNGFLEVAEAGRGRLVTVAQGYSPEVRPVRYSPGTRLDVALRPARAIALTVTDAAHELPVEEFRAIVLSRGLPTGNDTALAMALLDPVVVKAESGRTVVYADPDDDAELLVLAEGYRPGWVPRVPKEQDTLSVELDASGCSRRFVIDAETGEPLPGVRAVPIQLERMGTDAHGIAALMIAESDKEGRLTLCPLGGTEDVMILKAAGYAPRSVDLSSIAGKPTDPTIEMFQGASLRVDVVSTSGRAVAGVRVTVDTEGLLREGETNRHGTVTITELMPLEEALVSVFVRGGYSPAATSTIRLREGHEEKTIIYLPAEYRLRLLSSGQPVADARTILLDSGENEEQLDSVAETTAGKDGTVRFVLAHEPGPQALLAVCRDDSCLFHRWPAKRRDDSPFDPRDVHLGDLAIRGKVVSGDDSSGIEGALLTCSAGGEREARLWFNSSRGPLWFDSLGGQVGRNDPGIVAVSDRMGRFEVLLHEKCTQLEVKGPKPSPGVAPWGTTRVELTDLEQNDPIVVRLERRATIDVTARNRDGEVLPSIEASIWRWPEASTPELMMTGSGEKLALKVPDEGPWSVLVRAPGLAPCAIGPIDAAAGKRTPAFATLEKGAYILLEAASVETARRLLLADAQGIDWGRWANYSQAEDGLVAVGPLPLGEYFLSDDFDTERIRLRRDGERVNSGFSAPPKSIDEIPRSP